MSLDIEDCCPAASLMKLQKLRKVHYKVGHRHIQLSSPVYPTINLIRRDYKIGMGGVL